MIKSFRHRGLRELYKDGGSARVSPGHITKIERILTALDRSDGPEGMDLPGFRLHPLKGRMKGHYAVSVSGNWRVTFRFVDGHAVDVDYLGLPLGARDMAMKNPVHPGAIVREDCLKPLSLSVTEGAKRLGVGRQTLSNLVNEKASVSIEMAYRLSKAFGSTPETWLGMQMAFDLAQSRDLERQIIVKRIAAA